MMSQIKTVSWLVNSAETSQLPEYERKQGISVLIDFGYNRINTWDVTQSEGAAMLWADIAKEGWPKLVVWEGGMALLPEFLKLAHQMKIPVLQPITGWGGQSWVFHEIITVTVKTRVWTFEDVLEDTQYDLK